MEKYLKEDEAEVIFWLAEKLTGADHHIGQKKNILLSNVMSRMERFGFRSLKEYLLYAERNDSEYSQLISCLTIHSTQWFREQSHFDTIRTRALQHASALSSRGRTFRVWSAACSTGQEVYSVGLVLERVRQENPGFEYEVFGSDIDPISVALARKAEYRSVEMQDVPATYRHLLSGAAREAENLQRKPCD